MRIRLNIFLRLLLPLVALLTGSVTARAQEEEGVLYTLSTRCIPAEAASTYPTGASYAEATEVNVYCYAQPGFQFIRWEDESGNEVSTESSFYYSMPAHDTALIARFQYNPESPTEPTEGSIKRQTTYHFDMQPAEACGSIYCEGQYLYSPGDVKLEIGSSVYVTAYERPGYRFVNWTENGVEVSTDSSYYFTVEEEGHSYTANFVYDPTAPTEPGEAVIKHRLNINVRPAESCYSYTGSGEYVSGEKVWVSVSPNQYYIFDSWIDDQGSAVSLEVSEEPGFYYTMPDHNVTLTALLHYVFNPENPGEPSTPSIEDNGVAKKPRITMQDDTHVLIVSSTPGATIYYTLDGTEPSRSSEVYTGAVYVPGNVTVKAFAVREGLTDSNVATYKVRTYSTALPVFTFDNYKIKISSATSGSIIYYTIDGSEPTIAGTVYTEPLDAEEGMLYKAVACHPDLTDSDIAVYVFQLSNHPVPVPTVEKDFKNRKISLVQQDAIGIKVVIDSVEQVLSNRVTLDVTSDMKRMEITAFAGKDNRFLSETLVEDLVFHKTPKFSFDGHRIAVELDEEEPMEESAECVIEWNGIAASSGNPGASMDVINFGDANAYVQSDVAFKSDPISSPIDYFNTGRHAGIRNGHRLSEAICTWGDKEEDYTYLRLDGELNRADLDRVAKMTNLNALHMEADLEAEDYGGVFEGTGIETIFSNEYPEGMLKGMPRLTTLMWGHTDRALPDGRITEAANPNLLLWTPNINFIPSDAINTVEYTYASDGVPTDPEGSGVTGHAFAIQLIDGYPFNAHMPLMTDYINFKKTFKLTTVTGVCAGWETLTLPFSTEYITHERMGAIVPFAAWSGDINGPEHPFWLYRATSDGWEAAESIEAGVPYIISMPNNREYEPEFNLDGEITFWNSGEIWLGTSESEAKATDWTGGAVFTGTYMPIEEEGIRSMNVNETAEGVYAGSAFTADDVTLPFGAYVWAPGAPQSMPVFGGSTGASLPEADRAGVIVDTPASGAVRVRAARDCKIAIISTDGAVIRQFEVKAGESVTAEGLSRGLYIAAGVKVIVR